MTKSTILFCLLMVESAVAGSLIFDFVRGSDYLSANWPLFAKLGLCLLLILWTHALTVGGWKTWTQYVLVPLPVALGVFLAVAPFGVGYAALVALGAFGFLAYSVFSASRIKKDFVRFRADIILRPTKRGILLVFSLLAAGLVWVYSAETGQEINIGQKVGEIAVENSEKFLPAGIPVSRAELAQIMEIEFDRLTAPYKSYVKPVMAFLVFSIVGFIGGLAGTAYSLTQVPLFVIFKKIGFLRVHSVSVEKEEISFESSIE